MYVVAASSFFRRRIPFEEAFLEQFYPDQYPQYVRRTFVGIPLVPNRRWTAGAGANEESRLNDQGGGGNGRSPPPSVTFSDGDTSDIVD